MITWYIESNEGAMILKDKSRPDFQIPYEDYMNRMSSDQMQEYVNRMSTKKLSRKILLFKPTIEEFVNQNGIRKEDIVGIVVHGMAEHLFYYRYDI